MASNTSFPIFDGPSRFALQAAVFDLENPRLLRFRLRSRFSSHGATYGFADVWVAGATQGHTQLEEWRLTGWFMPDGLEETKMGDTVGFEANYSSRSRRGVIYIHPTSINGKLVKVGSLVGWEPA